MITAPAEEQEQQHDLMAWTTLRHRVDDGILTVTLDRPDRLNAFTPTKAGELERTFSEANENDDVRAVVVTGAGKAFCAGMNLSSEGNVFGSTSRARPHSPTCVTCPTPTSAGSGTPAAGSRSPCTPAASP
ncbi:enoyl-CoA hydratase-related protein [Streptomyces sp. NPDC002463]|uniref:enoyl-CoA hydratase-related protein n=1 Tax=Streptomyces sp. NPDC002463 TaxID=3364645 RepID=UPI00367A9CED